MQVECFEMNLHHFDFTQIPRRKVCKGRKKHKMVKWFKKHVLEECLIDMCNEADLKFIVTGTFILLCMIPFERVSGC